MEFCVGVLLERVIEIISKSRYGLEPRIELFMFVS
jgi:hypothetical protein